MTEGIRTGIVCRAILANSSATARAVRWFVETGELITNTSKDRMPYDADALKALVASGRLR